jgi:Cupin-like domain
MFKKDFNDFYIKRRFSSIPEPYPLKIDYFNDYYSAKRIEVEIKENEMLLIPAGWFHFVLSEQVDKDEKINVAVSFFTEYFGCPDCDINITKNYSNTLKTNIDTKINYKEQIDKSEPIKITSQKKYNKNVNINNIINMFGDEYIIVNKSKNKFFVSNFIKDIYPDNCIETYSNIKDILTNGKKENYYLLQSESDLSKIGLDVPDLIKNEKKKNYSFWLNFGDIYSGLHYDIHNNILLQLKGTKKIILFPPSERDKLHLINKLKPVFLCNLRKML